MKKVLSILLMATLFLTLPVQANIIRIDVRVRVEGGAQTHLDTRVSLPLGATAHDVLAILCGEKYKYNVSEWGVWIESLYGEGDTDGSMAWMYAVNDADPGVGVSDYWMQDNDVLVVYFIDWMHGSYAYFAEHEAEAWVGETVVLQLVASNFMEGLHPVANAQVRVTTGTAPIVMTYETDESGYVTIPLTTADDYIITAEKYGADGVSLISRPVTRIHVGAGERLAEGYQRIVTLTLMSINNRIIINRVPLDTDLRAVEVNGVMMLPFRAVAEFKGATVFWEADTRTVLTLFDGHLLRFSADGTVDGVPVVNIDDRVYVPETYMIRNYRLYTDILIGEDYAPQYPVID
jgi:hypothetical protein